MTHLLLPQLRLTKKHITFSFLFFIYLSSASQKVVPLYNGVAPGSESWNWTEKEGINPINKSRYAYNVTMPTLTIFSPNSKVANGSAVLLVPGGGMRVVMMENEGLKTAKELAKNGITVFVLKYRVAQLKTDTPWQEMMTKMKDTNFRKEIVPIRGLARADVNEAVKYIYAQATALKIDTNKLGMAGFSAGAALTLNYLSENQYSKKPAFIGLIYGVYSAEQKAKLKGNVPPVFIAAASDDQLAPVSNSVDLFSHLNSLKIPSELHIYAKGGHGLNAKPANSWANRFSDWMESMGFFGQRK